MTVVYEPRGRAREYAELAVNLYSGCSHGCVYCYAPRCLRIERDTFHAKTEARNNIIDQMRKELETGVHAGKRILLSFTTDPYQQCDDNLKLTRMAIEQIKKRKVNFEILTKGGMRAARDFDLYGSGDAFASTLTFLSDEDSKKFEPNAALPGDRLKAVETAFKMGITTWVSCEPVIDPAQTLEIIERTHKFVHLFKVGKLNNIDLGIQIDWAKFLFDAVKLLKRLGVNYYIKKDLAAFGISGKNLGVLND